MRGVRIGVPDRFFWDGVDTEIVKLCRSGLDRLQAQGAEVLKVPVPNSTDEVMVDAKTDVYTVTNLAEATSYHRQLARERGYLYGPEVLALIEAGEAITAPDYIDAQRRRSVGARQWQEIFAAHRLDAIAHPTVQQPPSKSFAVGPQITLTKALSNNGFPALSVPVGLDSRGPPVGLLLAGLPLAEAPLLQLGIALDDDVRFFEQVAPAGQRGREPADERVALRRIGCTLRWSSEATAHRGVAGVAADRVGLDLGQLAGELVGELTRLHPAEQIDVDLLSQRGRQ